MYEQFYGLREKPFRITPNPEFVFYTDRYRATLEQLLYGIEHREGFMLLVGAVGTGKTTLCRTLLEQLDPLRYRTALIFNPFLNATELLQALLTEYGCRYTPGATKKELLDQLNRFLLAQLVQGKTCVAIFDEAQHLSAELLEQIRVLSNLETDREKLLQIVLAGQPELKDRIQQRSLAQLDQRISLRCSLTKLDVDETERYIYHRLNVAGSQGKIRLQPAAVRLVHKSVAGIPRLINQVCERTLLAAYVDQSWDVTKGHVKQGIASLRGEESDEASHGLEPAGRPSGVTIIAAILVLVAVGAAFYWLGRYS